jgi:hypothetical protein
MAEYPNYSGQQAQNPNTAPNSTTAIISLIAGILGLSLLPFIGSIVALITGSMAKKEIAQSMGRLSGEGMAQIGIILGWIGIGFAVLGACIGGIFFLLPFCMVALGLSMEGWGFIIPVVLAVF